MTTAAKPGAPVVGFNHNVKYGPRVYHVQTEDSGLPHAHYITHLFVGGNIVASMKTSYADKAADPNLHAVVRSLMEGQHKAMLRRLVAGEFSELAERLSAQHYDPGVLADGTNTASYVNTPVAKTAPPKPAPARPAPKPAPKPQQPLWHPAPPAPGPALPRRPPRPAAAAAPPRSAAHGPGPAPPRSAARGSCQARAGVQRHAGRGAARRSSDAVCGRADQREEPRRSHPRLPLRGPR